MSLGIRWHRLPFAALSILSCAPRELPSSFPESSAASPSAAEPAPPPATRALTEDPPLPGEDVSRWPGLAPASGAHAEHAGHDAAAPNGVVYVCPMHPEIRRDAPGKCPICGMALVRKP